LRADPLFAPARRGRAQGHTTISSATAHHASLYIPHILSLCWMASRQIDPFDATILVFATLCDAEGTPRPGAAPHSGEESRIGTDQHCRLERHPTSGDKCELWLKTRTFSTEKATQSTSLTTVTSVVTLTLSFSSCVPIALVVRVGLALDFRES
jgi:hypothetical protein